MCFENENHGANMAKVNVVLGTDWWTDCDDVAALRIMSRMHLEGSIELCGVCINACMDESAASLSAFLLSEGLGNVAIGLDREATDFGAYRDVWYQTRLASHPHYATNETCEDAVKLYRRILGESGKRFDIVEIGYPQVLADLLKSEGDEYSPLNGKELVRKKVNKLWVMAGNWQAKTGIENNFCRNERSRIGGNYLCEHWPTPITFLGWEVGNSVLTGGKISDDSDLLKQAMNDIGYFKGRSSWDPMLCLMACMQSEEKAGYDVVRGRASVDRLTGENSFEIDEKGSHCYVVKKYNDSYYADEIDALL